jgi:hypothetical protein
MSTRWARFARGWVTASFSVLVAALSHVAAGGAMPGLFGAVVALAFGGMVSVFLAGRTLSLPRLAISVAFSQAIFHLLFTATGTATALASTVAGTGPTHHLTALAPFTVDAATALPHSGHFDATMWFAHALAAVLTVVALRHGETAFWGLLRLATSGFRAVVAGVAAPLIPTRTGLDYIAVEHRHAHTQLDDYVGQRNYRGPPRFAAVSSPR